jgi:DNA-binding transcriptional regulator YiaG
MVDGLHAVCDAIESGIPLERAATVRTLRIPSDVPPPSPGEIRAIRDSLGLSQAGFADFLGAGLNTVRSWEIGRREPSALARRLLGAIRDDPAYWRGRLAKMVGRRDLPPASRHGGRDPEDRPNPSIDRMAPGSAAMVGFATSSVSGSGCDDESAWGIRRWPRSSWSTGSTTSR